MQKYLFFIFLILSSCQQAATDAKSHTPYHPVNAGERRFDFKTYRKIRFALPSGKLIEAFISDTLDKQTQGLSGVKEGELKINQGMLFTYKETARKQFWMPNTYMNLDIYFMDASYHVIHVDRNVAAHPGMSGEIPRSSTVYAQNILEIPTSSTYASEIKKGMTLIVIQ